MDAPAIEREWSHPESWAALAGLWTFEGGDEASATYRGPDSPEAAYGVAVTDLDFRGGVYGATITLDEPESAGRLIFGHDPASGAHYSAGIGGRTAAYAVEQFVPGRGWATIEANGNPANLAADHPYEVLVYLYGQLMWLEVDDVEVLRVHLPEPLPGHHLGAVAWSSGKVAFTSVSTIRELPEAFVVMQFGSPYDDLYRDVIEPTCDELKFAARRADDVYAPGIILQDIVAGLVRATVVIAEITPVNANVFYELGYAHALNKTTILLAERGGRLPFDVSGYRCIFYDNTIGGKSAVQKSLAQYLQNIR